MKHKSLNLMFFILLNLIAFQNQLYAQQINKLDYNINKGEISDSDVNKNLDISAETLNSSINSRPKSAEKINSKVSNKSNLPLKEKQFTINVNGKKRIISIPIFSKKMSKKHSLQQKSKRVNESQVLIRINDDNETNYDLPVPYSLFGFPLDPKDEKRCEAEKIIGEIYNSILSMNDENYVDIVNSVHRIGFAAIEKYSNYPDICAITQLYLNESFIKMYKINDSYDELYSTSREYFKLLQLSTQYSHLNDSNPTMKTLYQVIGSRMNELKGNEKNLVKSIDYYFKQVQSYYKTLNYYKENINFGIPSESRLEEYANNIAETYSNICFSYARIYEKYMQMNNKAEADKIFKIDGQGKGLKASGLLFEAYNSTPYDQFYKYKYQDSSNGETVTKTGEIKVLMFRDADKFLRIIENMKYLQTIDKIDKIIGDQSENEKRTLGMCQYLNDYELDTGSEQKSAAEKISDEKLANYKKYAYAQLQMDSYIDYYKRKPVIKDLYVARTEDTKLSPSTVVRPDEFLVLCAKPDLSNYSKLAAPGYAFLCKIYTLKSYTMAEDSIPTDPSLTVPIVLSKSETTPEIDKQKFIALIPDVLNGGYYAKFQINESDNKTISAPIKKLSATTNYNKNDDVIISKMLINKEKDTEIESLSIIFNGFLTDINDQIQFQGAKNAEKLYLTNKYFLNKTVPSLRNIRGLFNNIIDKEQHMIVPQFSKENILSGGMQYCYFGFVGGYNNTPPIATSRIMVRNQADWLIIGSHGALSAEAGMSGGVAFANTQGKLDFAVSPAELIKNIDTASEESEFSEDIDVLLLLSCTSLALTQETNNCVYARGWHRVLPKGIILGFNGFSSDIINKSCIYDLHLYLNQLADNGQKITHDGLKEFWREKNEYYYNMNMSGKPYYEKLDNAKNATVIYGDKRYTYRPEMNIKLYPPRYEFMANEPDTL